MPLIELITAVAALVATAVSLLNSFIIIFVTAWIKKRYDKQLEQFRFDLRLRERAATIAELFAEWNAQPSDPRRLNQLICEASIWLPAPIVRDLGRTLTDAPDRKQPKEILIDVRRFLRGAADDLTAAELVHFEPPLKS